MLSFQALSLTFVERLSGLASEGKAGRLSLREHCARGSQVTTLESPEDAMRLGTRDRSPGSESAHHTREARVDPRVHTRPRMRAPEHGSTLGRESVRGPADPRSGTDPRAWRTVPCSDRVSAPRAADPRADHGSVRGPMDPRPSVDHVTDVRNRARA